MSTRQVRILLGVLAVAVVAVALGVAAARGWTPTQALPTARGEHARAVADLERRVAGEDGWVVVSVPNLHEGGGTTTWWLHPCDPVTDRERAVVRTAFHGSDVAGLSGVHQVERDTLPCTGPARTVDLAAGRRLHLDVEVVDLDGTWGLVEDHDRVVVDDPAQGVEVVVDAAGSTVAGPCDGRTAWTGSLHGSRVLELRPRGCVGTLAALPADARDLLDLPPGGDGPADRDRAGLDVTDLATFGAALEAAGWRTDSLDVHTFDGTETAPRWIGPCGRPASDGDGASRPEADWYAGTVEVREAACP